MSEEILNKDYFDLSAGFEYAKGNEYDNYSFRLKYIIQDIVFRKKIESEKRDRELYKHEEEQMWKEALILDTIEAYEEYLKKYEYDSLYYDEASLKLENLYEVKIINMNYDNFPKAKEYIWKNWKSKFRVSNPLAFGGFIQDEVEESINQIKLCNQIMNNSKFEKFEAVRKNMLEDASRSYHIQHLKEDYIKFFKIQEYIKKILILVDLFKSHTQYEHFYKNKYIKDLFLRINDSSSPSYPEDRLKKEIKKLEFKISFQVKDCTNKKINYTIVEKEFEKFNNIEEESYYSSFLNIGQVVYYTEYISFELENTPNPLFNLLKPFHTIKIYIGQFGIAFYNEKLVSYEQIKNLLYSNCIIENQLNEHKYLKNLDEECKNKIIEVSNNRKEK